MESELDFEDAQEQKFKDMKKAVEILAEEKNREFITYSVNMLHNVLRQNRISHERADRIIKELLEHLKK